MALPTPGDRAAETSVTTGTGTYSLDGAILGWRTIVDACGTGKEVDYFVRDVLGTADYEIGRGVITDSATDTLTRATIYSSSNGGAAVNWGVGTREIVVTLTANAMNQLLADEDIGVTVQGYTSVLANTTASFLTADKSKLDGIEASADVTDTTNVTAAGALMDSEVTNLAQVKAFDTTDYATSAQGTLATNALPKAGGAMTGAITTNSTFDGRDVATDGTKLDTIETNADVTDTTNVTSAGALMDSEVTNLAQVKAFDTSDYATATQGTTADNALAASAVSTFGGTLIDDADASTARTTLGLGTAATTASTDYVASSAVSTFGGTLIDDVDASTARTTLGLGTAATTASTDYATAAQGTTADNASPLVTTVTKTSSTGAGLLPSGTTAQRDGSPAAGYIRFNSTTGSFEGYDGSAWGAIGGGGGASAGGAIYENSNEITANYTLTTDTNGMSVSPMTIASGVTVTVPSGQRWVVL